MAKEQISEEVMASSIALKLAKKELRSLMKNRLEQIGEESVNTQSGAVFSKTTTSKAFQDAKRVGIYLSMPSGEIQTEAIVRHALENGKKVFVPYLSKPPSPPPDTPKSVMDMVDLRSISDYDSLKRDSWGIPTIGADTVEEREHILHAKDSEGLDMILMPGVAFDIDPETGFVRRLGHGKGFYDYFLHRYQQSRGSLEKKPLTGPGTDVFLYGLALKEQFLEAEATEPEPSVPVGEHDNLLHGLFVGDGRVVERPIKNE